MSWYFSVPPTPRDQFVNAVVTAKGEGNTDSELAQKQIAAAKDKMCDLATLVQRDLISGYASGHALLESDGPMFYDGISVQVSGIRE